MSHVSNKQEDKRNTKAVFLYLKTQVQPSCEKVWSSYFIMQKLYKNKNLINCDKLKCPDKWYQNPKLQCGWDYNKFMSRYLIQQRGNIYKVVRYFVTVLSIETLSQVTKTKRHVIHFQQHKASFMISKWPYTRTES